jgi:hypothetical protein
MSIGAAILIALVALSITFALTTAAFAGDR